jgi:molecular chaperone DnaK
MDSKQVFGIDLGTTYSCIAVMDELSGKPTVLSNADGDATTPSVVYFQDEQTRVVGKEAKKTAVIEPDRVVEMVKRQMGNADWRWTFGGREYSAEEISALILRKIANDVEQFHGMRCADVVITCPAYFGISQRDATAAAGAIAGLNVLEVIDEPTAAAIAYGLQGDTDQVILVYDLGGGTFDVSIIEVKDGSVTVIAIGGDHELGGHDWDEEIVRYLIDEWMTRTGTGEDPADSAETLQELRRRAEDAKRALSSEAETKVLVSHGGSSVTVTLTRERFEELTQHLMENTLSLTRETMMLAQMKGYPDVDQMVLVGGATRMPQVAGRLRREFGTEPRIHDPDQAVAKGAAIYGRKLSIGRRVSAEIASEPGTPPGQADAGILALKARARAQQAVAADLGMRVAVLRRLDDMTVTNVASHSFGVVAYRQTGFEPDPYIVNLVLAQAPLPATRTREFATIEDGQAAVQLRVMESAVRREEIDELEQASEVGDVILPLTAGLPAGSPVEVTFELNRQGRLVITGKDLAVGGRSIVAAIETSRVLSAAEVARAASEMRGVRVTG